MTTPNGSGQESRHAEKYWIAVVALAFAGVVVVIWFLYGRPTDGWRWDVLLAAGSIAFAAGPIVALAAFLEQVHQKWRRWWKRQSRRTKAILASSVVALLAAVIGVSLRIVLTPDTLPCEAPDELRVLTSPDQLAVVEDLAWRYEQSRSKPSEVDDRGVCLSVNIHVSAATTDTAVDTLTNGWTAVNELGPRPDVWITELQTPVNEVADAIEGADIDLVELHSEQVAESPMVLAVAESERDSATQVAVWADVIPAANANGWTLIRPHPDTSAGLLAVAAHYGGDTDEASAEQIELRVSDANNVDALLSYYRYSSEPALLITEQTVVRFNQGNQAAGRCPPGRVERGDEDKAATPLVAIYPTDTLFTEYTVASLAWRHQSRQARAATELVEWMSTSDGQEALAAIGLRPRDVPFTDLRGPLGSDACGTTPGVPGGRRPPLADELARARALYQQVRPAGRVLLAVDLSGSMGRDVPGMQGATRYDIAQRAVEGALERLGDRDEVGLWVFRRGGHREQIPIDRGAEEHRGTPRKLAVAATLEGMEPAGGTPLLLTILEGFKAAEDPPDLASALVVVTDGQDTTSPPEAGTDLAALDNLAGPRVFVIAIGDANCTEVAEVTSATGGDCIPADFATLDDQLDQLFRMLWRGN